MEKKSAETPSKHLRPAKRGKSFEPAVATAFGAVVREQRLKKEIAQDQFALIAGVDRSYFGKLERGERQPSLAIMLRISGALGIPAASIMRKVEAALLTERKAEN